MFCNKNINQPKEDADLKDMMHNVPYVSLPEEWCWELSTQALECNAHEIPQPRIYDLHWIMIKSIIISFIGKKNAPAEHI